VGVHEEDEDVEVDVLADSGSFRYVMALARGCAVGRL
jgi:hypothetical protein